MNILFLVPYAPTRIRTRPYNLIRSLAKRHHAVTLATLWETERERQALDELADDGIRVVSARLTQARKALNTLRALPTRTPLQAMYCWQPALAEMVYAQLGDGSRPVFDIVHVEHLRGARYGLWLREQMNGGGTRLPIIWDSVDCISRLFALAAHRSRSRFGRWATRLELPRTRRYEGFLVSQFDRVLATSEADKAALEKLAEYHGSRIATRHLSPGAAFREARADATRRYADGRGIRTGDSRSPTGVDADGTGEQGVGVLANGVDLAYFTPNFGPRTRDTIILTGKMSYHANVTAALHLVNDIMPHVWARRPEVRVKIIGSAPPPEVCALAAQHSPRVSVTSYVPDMRPHLWSATLAVAPLPYGAGVQNKVLEAMACATPVVATPLAVSALSARAGADVLVADGPQPFASEVLRLLGNDNLRRQVGAAGRSYVAEHHDWAAIAGQLEELYRELVTTAQ